ncbi:unknown protein [Calothrix sp. PCC 7716]|nr:unknown protein [Calothrix sp. PCC 7716]
MQMTEAMYAANLQEKINQLGITDESIAKRAQEIGIVSSEEKEQAKQQLAQIVSQIHEDKAAQAQVTIEGVEPINITSFESNNNNQIQEQTINVESQPSNTDKKDDDNNKTETTVENQEFTIVKNLQIQQVIIPKLLEVLSNKGQPENGAVVYQGEKYTVGIKLEENSNTLSLDRNSDSENKEALIASKGSDEPNYSIIVNNITQAEFERFKLLFEEQNRRTTQQTQQQDNVKSVDNEIG